MPSEGKIVDYKIRFNFFWFSYSSAANQLRVSVEFLLDHLAVPRERVCKDGKTHRYDLNGRIQHYEKTDPHHGKTIDALRMVGNLGSHSSQVTLGALMDAYEIYEDCLLELIGQRSAYMQGLRDKLIVSKGDYLNSDK